MCAALLVVASVALVNSPARAGVAELPPIEGCYDTVAGAVGLFDGRQTPSGGIQLDVGGPVALAIVEWVGQDDQEAGVASVDLDLAGPAGTASGSFTGTLAGTDMALNEPIFAWYADVTSLFGAGEPGTYTVDVSPFATPNVGFNWGATITVVYDTSPCEAESLVNWKIGTDYYFGGDGAATVSNRTEVVVYEFGPSVEDRVAEIRLSHGGADSTASTCRVSAIWMATGSGNPPTSADDLVDAGGTAAFPGAREVVVGPFSPPGQPCPAPSPAAPVIAFRGGNVGPEYALVEMDVAVPVGVEWVAIQLESPTDNGGFRGIPESGAWAGAASFVLTEATDPYAPVPGIVLEKTVLSGDGACPGVEGTDELVIDDPGSAATYCYRIINDGDTHLSPVTLSDPDLGITADDMTLVAGDPTVPLAPGAELVYSHPTTITGPQDGTAFTEGIPVEPDGTPIDTLDPVTDTNNAAVDTTPDSPVPGIVLEKTVLSGDGACPGVEGTDELVIDDPGSAATYCYRIINDGDTHLSPVTLSDPDLGITADDMTLVAGDPTVPLAPGAELVYSYPTTITGPQDGTAFTEGIPVEPDGTPIDTLDPVTDTNNAAVDTTPDSPVPGIVLEKTVLSGDGACPGVEGTDELVIDDPGSAATYCYRIINDGDTHLSPVTLSDPDLGITADDMTLVAGDPTVPLAPGAELVYSYPTTITGPQDGTAFTEGIPVEPDGTPIDTLDPVTDTNNAAVDTTPSPGATLALEKTVLAGLNPACPGVEGVDELVIGTALSPASFCYRIINNGDNPLFPITLVDPDLGVMTADLSIESGTLTEPLLPGQEVVLSLPVVGVSGVSLATVTATPSDLEGEPLGLDQLVVSNDAGIELLVASLRLEKTVRQGHTASCPGSESIHEIVTAPKGTAIRYCFRVLNTGTTDLFPVDIVDQTLGITHADMTLVSGDPSVPLPPGSELVYAYNDTLDGPLVNVATVTAVPSDPNGMPLEATALVDVNDARVSLQEILPVTGSSSMEHLRLALTLLMAGVFAVAATRIVIGDNS